MDKSYEEKYHSIEHSNWWFLSRRNAIRDLLKNHDRSLKILDVGCAGGPLLIDLKTDGFINLFGLDFSEEAVKICKDRGLTNVFVMDGHNPNFEPNYFDVIISSDSLEHLEHDELALSNWNKILKPGGELLVFVPAYNFLWSGQDVINHHFRRYSKKLLVTKITKVGFTIDRANFWNFAIFFPTAVFRLFQRAFMSSKINNAPKDQLSFFNPIISKIIFKWMKFENKIFKNIGLPIGVSVFVKAKKQRS